MDTAEYLKNFYPFKMPDFKKKGVESVWNSQNDDDHLVKALMLTYTGKRDPQAMAMSFIRDYGERYEWMAEVFKDWAFTLMTTHFYYDKNDPANAEAYKAAVACDTMGDTRKDVIGVALDIFIKIMSTVSLVAVSVFAHYNLWSVLF